MDEISIWLLVSLAALMLGSAGLAFWAWMLGECLAYEPRGGLERPLWTALIATLLPPAGAFLYFVLRRPHRIARYGE